MAIKYMNEFILFLLLGILLYYYLGKKIREGVQAEKMSKIEEWVGEYDVNYTNGFKTKYTISSDGKVSGTNLPNDGWKGGGILSLRTNKHEKCPAYPCAWLAGVHSKDKDEYMALKDGDLHINHYIKGKLCCTGLGKRISGGGDKESMCVPRPDQTESSFASQCPLQKSKEACNSIDPWRSYQQEPIHKKGRAIQAKQDSTGGKTVLVVVVCGKRGVIN